MKDPKQKVSDWVKEIIVGMNLCPFAEEIVKENLLRIVIYEDHTKGYLRDRLLDELARLNNSLSSEISSTLIVFPKLTLDFYSFYELIDEFQAEWEEAGLLEHYQMVVFHPEFVFAEKDPEDRANWVNRSPYPLVHLLRQEEIERVTKGKRDVGVKISLDNEKKLKDLSSEQWQIFLKKIHQ